MGGNPISLYDDQTGLVVLTQGRTMLISLEDEGLVRQCAWRASHTGRGKWYARSRMGYFHRLIFGPAADGLEVDHIDGDSLNNRRTNLRLCTRAQNCCNQSKTGATSLPRGIIATPAGTFEARVKYRGRLHYGGTFKCIDDAVLARAALARQLHGAFYYAATS